MQKSFVDITTMHLGGVASDYHLAESADEAVELTRSADADDIPVLVVGGGSNLVVGDSGFDGRVLHVGFSGIRVDDDLIAVDAGTDWDSVVATTIEDGFGGLETLSGVPGSTGGTPVQNVGAYGTLISEYLEYVTVYDRQSREVTTIAGADCGFGSHRQSIFKHSDRWVILTVHLRLPRTTTSQPIRYAGLAQALGCEIGDRAPVDEVRQTVLELRRSRGMVYDESDRDTWCVGSFFINHVLKEVPAKAAAAPTYPDPAGIKLPAGWLIDHAGFPPGYGADFARGRVRLSPRHALVVTNRGDATTAEVMAFAAHIREGVEAAFDIRLGPECDLVNCSFDDAPPDWLAELI